MSSGRNRISRNSRGFSLVEVVIASLLVSMIFLAFTSLHVASFRFFLTAKDKVAIGHELQYSAQHIYEHVLVGIDDGTNPAITIISPTEFRVNYIDKESPGAPKTGYYRITGGRLEFDKDYTGTFTVDESLGSDVTFRAGDCEFAMDGNLFTVKLTAEFPVAREGEKQELTWYSSCYPRLAAF